MQIQKIKKVLNLNTCRPYQINKKVNKNKNNNKIKENKLKLMIQINYNLNQNNTFHIKNLKK